MIESPTAFQLYSLETPNGRQTLTGRVIGKASSHHERHRGHEPGQPLPKGVTCSACRWIEITIFRLSPEESNKYAVHTLGRTSIPGESDRSRLAEPVTASQILELLADRRNSSMPRLPKVAALAISMAADLDPAVNDAYVNRAFA